MSYQMDKFRLFKIPLNIFHNWSNYCLLDMSQDMQECSVSVAAEVCDKCYAITMYII